MRAIIIYYTKTGHTRDAAGYVAEGLRAAGAEVRVLHAPELSPQETEGCDALLVGSPCRAGAIPAAGGVAGVVRRALLALPAGCLEGKVAAAFSVHCAVGGGQTVRTLRAKLEALGAIAPVAGMVVRAGAFLSLYRGPEIKPHDAERLRAFGAAVGNVE